MNTRQIGSDPPDGFDGFTAVAPVFFNACRDRESKWVVEDLVGGDAKFDSIPVGALSNGEFAFRRAGHAVFIDGSDDYSSAIGSGQFQYLEEAFVAVFVIGGVQ